MVRLLLTRLRFHHQAAAGQHAVIGDSVINHSFPVSFTADLLISSSHILRSSGQFPEPPWLPLALQRLQHASAPKLPGGDEQRTLDP